MTAPGSYLGRIPRRPRGWQATSREGLLRRQEETMQEDFGRGQAAGDAYEEWAQGFDAGDAVNEYARGAWGSISDRIGKQLDTLRGSAVGAGRLDTGFFDEDQGEVMQAGMRDFSHAVSQQAMGAAQLDASVQQNYGSYGERARGNATDLLMSRREEEENNYREAEERKRRRRGGIVVGGPAGAAAGWKGGQKVGQGVANW
jgi:hypothetical protein